MGYELVIRSRTPHQPLSEADLTAVLCAAADTGLPELPTEPFSLGSEAGAAAAPLPSPVAPAQQPSCSGPWTLRNGKGRLVAQLSRLEGRFRGVDFEVLLPCEENELRRAYLFIQQLAETLGATVFDPQLAREVGRPSVDEVVGKWKQSQAWLVDVAGMIEDPRSLGEMASTPPLVSRRGLAVLAIAGGFAFVYWLIGAVAELLKP
ncbi:MAG: hypothetical protein HY901_28310 [Deltaproteobacteria bacterium]|nr:hypothetical protein [Deltaproteobacteria bacterium]